MSDTTLCPLCECELDEHIIQGEACRLFCSCCYVEFIPIYCGTTLAFQMIAPHPIPFLFEEDGS